MKKQLGHLPSNCHTHYGSNSFITYPRHLLPKSKKQPQPEEVTPTTINIMAACCILQLLVTRSLCDNTQFYLAAQHLLQALARITSVTIRHKAGKSSIPDGLREHLSVALRKSRVQAYNITEGNSRVTRTWQKRGTSLKRKCCLNR